MTRVLRTMMTLATATLCMATALPAAAQFAKPEDAIKYRKAVFTVMGTHFGRVAAMANGRIPFDAKVAAESAEIATSMSKLPFVAFGPGTDKGETRAKPEIWTDTDKVKRLAEKMHIESVQRQFDFLDQFQSVLNQLKSF